MNPTVLLIDAHPRPESFCAGLSLAYANAARTAGAAVDVMALRDLRFDLNLHAGYAAPQALEPDLVDAQARILAADHLALAYPVWWGTYPALLKGFFDRTLLPGFAFKYHPGGNGWDRLLAGRSARVLATMDWPAWAYHLYLGAPSHKAIGRATLGFCGIDPVRVTSFDQVNRSTPALRARWIARAEALARQDVRAIKPGRRASSATA